MPGVVFCISVLSGWHHRYVLPCLILFQFSWSFEVIGSTKWVVGLGASRLIQGRSLMITFFEKPRKMWNRERKELLGLLWSTTLPRYEPSFFLKSSSVYVSLTSVLSFLLWTGCHEYASFVINSCHLCMMLTAIYKASTIVPIMAYRSILTHCIYSSWHPFTVDI